jgi:hypothetical protein
MTGKARIHGHTREQHIWLTLAQSRAPMSQAQLTPLLNTLMSQHQLCHALTRMWHDGRVQRVYGEYRHRYRAIGSLPADNRSPETRMVRRNSPFGLDDPDATVDNRNRGEVAPGTNAPPAIPTLAELLART